MPASKLHSSRHLVWPVKSCLVLSTVVDREPVNSSHRKIVWRPSCLTVLWWVDRPFWPSTRPTQELRRRRWLRSCTLAIGTPSVLSTVSGCYLTGVQIKKLWLVALLCARLWRVDCVMRRVCDEMTGSRWTTSVYVSHGIISWRWQ